MKKDKDSKLISAETIILRKKKILEQIDDLICNIQNEIEMHKVGLGTESSIPTLEQIKEELQNMKVYLSPTVYLPTFNYIIRDSWNEFPKLGIRLLKVYHEYKEKLL